MDRKVTLILQGEKPISWNEFYSQKVSIHRRHQLASHCHLAVRAALDPEAPMFTGRVMIEIRVYFINKREWLDWSNIPAKLYEDGLKGWLIAEDNPDHVPGGRVFCFVDKENPRIEIDVIGEDHAHFTAHD